MSNANPPCETSGFIPCGRALAAAVTAVPLVGSVRGAQAADEQQGVASSRMSYSRFLEYLDMGRVKKVPLPYILLYVHCAAAFASREFVPKVDD